MTQEIKLKLEQAAETARLLGKPWTVLTGDKKSAFMLAAKTILENPDEWGLCSLEIHKQAVKTFDKITTDAINAEREIVDERNQLQSQLTKYREALERIAEYDFDTRRVSPHTIAKEALKQQ